MWKAKCTCKRLPANCIIGPVHRHTCVMHLALSAHTSTLSSREESCTEWLISACAAILASLKLEQHLTVWWSNTRAISSHRHSLGAEWHRRQLRLPMPANTSTARDTWLRMSALQFEAAGACVDITSSILPFIFQMLNFDTCRVGDGILKLYSNLTAAKLLFWGKDTAAKNY